MQDSIGYSDKLEESDLLRLLILNRDVDLFETQTALLKMKVTEAKRNLDAFNQQIKVKYNLVESDSIDANTGDIVRNKTAD